jgi:hypothetical protein
MNQTFYMVFMEGGSNPTYRHATLSGAETEAKRLAKMHKKKTWVLTTIKSFELNEFAVADCRPDTDLPF